MRAILAGCVLALLGTAAQAQPYFGDGYDHRPPPPYDDGYGHRPPPPPPFGDDGYRHRPPPRYDGDFDGPPPRRHHRHCRTLFDDFGPHRICRPDF